MHFCFFWDVCPQTAPLMSFPLTKHAPSIGAMDVQPLNEAGRIVPDASLKDFLEPHPLIEEAPSPLT